MARPGLFTLLMLLTCFAFAQKRSIALKLKPGATYSFVIKQTSTTSQTIRQRPLETRLILTAGMRFMVSNVTEGDYTLNTTFDSIKLQLELPNGDLQFNTEKRGDSGIYAVVLKSLKKRPFNIRLSKTGKIMEVEGSDNNLQKAIADTKADTAQRQQALEQLRQSVGSTAITNLLQKIFNIYPEVAVSNNDKWIIQTQNKGEPDIATRNYYMVKTALPKSIVIQGNGTIQSVAPARPALLNGMPVERNLAGDTYVNITTDYISGWPLRAEINEKLNGVIIINDNPQLPGGLAIPININNIVTLSIP
ncbi:hypothetical protein GCM10023313_27380 [Mucilaginibacter defluvii]|uniref:DUF4138 domain-containing protein n=2 Tax=Mucilaginibacter defluvii TaxID=1196019 RepID=A0ABP9FZB4_9SPHI